MAMIFLSHSSKNQSIAESFKSQLEQMHSTVYMFEHNQRPGQGIASKVQKEIRNADMIFVLLTQESQSSAYVQQEIGFAKGLGKIVIPFVEAGIDSNALAMLTGEEYLKFDPNNPDRSVSEAQVYVHNHDMQKLAVDVGLILFAALAFCLLVYALRD